MRKHRTWWMGLGIGIILGATMLQLIQFAEAQDSGLTLAEDAKQYSQRELDERVAEAVEEARKPANDNAAEAPGASGTPGQSAAPAESPSASASGSASPAPSSSPSASLDTEHEKAFYVTPGMDLKTVARSLKRLGVIEDAEDFTDEARTISKQIKPGTSLFKGKLTYEEIIAELIRTKED